MELTGKLIVAMPAMGDTRFERSVILICVHSDDGAMGLIVNKPVTDFSFSDLLTQMKIPKQDSSRDIRVHFGGPVERGRGFVLHSDDYVSAGATTQVRGGYGMTATVDVLEALRRAGGPSRRCWRWAMPVGGRGSWNPRLPAMTGWSATRRKS